MQTQNFFPPDNRVYSEQSRLAKMEAERELQEREFKEAYRIFGNDIKELSTSIEIKKQSGDIDGAIYELFKIKEKAVNLLSIATEMEDRTKIKIEIEEITKIKEKATQEIAGLMSYSFRADKKSGRRSVGKPHKSARKSSRKAKKSTRKPKKSARKVKKSTRKSVRKSVRKSTRKVKKSTRKAKKSTRK